MLWCSHIGPWPLFPPTFGVTNPSTPCVVPPCCQVSAAEDILRRVAAASPASREIVGQMSELIEGYIELAAVPPPSKDADSMPFPAGLRRSKQ